jgi:CheY-like chemotaxis protein
VRSVGTGAGTTVVVRLPLLSGGGAAPAALEDVAARPGGANRMLEQPSANVKLRSVPARTSAAAKSTVLLIEDNVDSREMMSMLLGMLGYQVLEAANGTDGLRLAQNERPAIAVIDIGLPDIDGYAVARQLRATTGLHNMTLIALTGYGQDADRKRALAAGFDSHLVKPLDMDVLVNTIISHQAKQNAHSQGAGSDV